MFGMIFKKGALLTSREMHVSIYIYQYRSDSDVVNNSDFSNLLLVPRLFAMLPCLAITLFILSHASTGKFRNSVCLSVCFNCPALCLCVKSRLYPDLTKTRTHVEI